MQSRHGGSDGRFQSTPSVWRVTLEKAAQKQTDEISIHTLRVEGDAVRRKSRKVFFISIHTLRVEGDRQSKSVWSGASHFNPHPPCGG